MVSLKWLLTGIYLDKVCLATFSWMRRVGDWDVGGD